MDMNILSNVFDAVARCPGNKLKLLQTKKQGISFEMMLSCLNTECQWTYCFWTSKKKKKVRSFDINRRVYYSLRRIGNGYEGLKRFLVLMNHPPPMTEKNYRKIAYAFNKGVKEVAGTVMQDACIEIRRNSPDEIIDTAVSLDGTWQKRGFTSYNGAVVAISIPTGRIVDVEVMSRYCQACIQIESYKSKDVALYEKYKIDHDCTINHSGSAPAMEQVGVKRIFGRSIDKNKLCYMEYYGGGDTKSFSVVENVYPETKVLKKECIGHIQKRIGNKLRKKKKTEKGLGKLGLVSGVIAKLQNYYGMAVRSNVGNMVEMKKNIYAAWCHVCSSDKNNFHIHCPKWPTSWCTYQCDITNGTKTHLPGKGLPFEVEVIKHVKQVFDELSDDNLLLKYLHGKTQNQNEAFNGTIWNRIV